MRCKFLESSAGAAIFPNESATELEESLLCREEDKIGETAGKRRTGAKDGMESERPEIAKDGSLRVCASGGIWVMLLNQRAGLESCSTVAVERFFSLPAAN